MKSDEPAVGACYIFMFALPRLSAAFVVVAAFSAVLAKQGFAACLLCFLSDWIYETAKAHFHRVIVHAINFAVCCADMGALTPAERTKRYKKRHPERFAAGKAKSDRSYRIRNAEKVKDQLRAYYLRTRENQLEDARNRRLNNPGLEREKRKRYYLKHPEKRRQAKVRSEINRRAKKLKSGGRIGVLLYDKLYVLQKGRCVVCRDAFEKMDMDHIFPLALGGSNAEENIQLLCSLCNNRKHVKHPVDFMQANGYLL
jgi:5-methylcytosine-specific restriction endonuclease McrA